MLLASQIAGFLNQLFLPNKSLKKPHFLHVDTNSQKCCSKIFLFGQGQNWVLATWSLDSKIDCISRMSRWN